MTFSEFETKRLDKIVGAFIDERRPPAHVRARLDLAYRLKGQSVEIFEVRPLWAGAPGKTMEQPIAKATYVKARGRWRIYWHRVDLKWHSYEPVPQVGSIEKFLALVREDEHPCFFG